MGNDNDDISLEGHFKNYKISSGSYLNMKLVIFVQIFYLVTQSFENLNCEHL
jgi:hypothetical protein